MRKTLSILIMSLFVALDATAQSQDFKEYNLGVDAFRAKNYESARQHWTLALAQDNSNAYNNLGFLLFNGLGGSADPVRAVALWRNAAMMGNAESQWHLGYAYEAGQGSLRNAVEAYAWYRCAENSYRLTPVPDKEASEATQDASQSVTRVRAKLPEDQRKVAEELARIYIALYSRAESDG
jgi:tetratricopeptide (TPR) repeat protein